MSAATILLVRHGHHSEVGTILSGRSEIALDATGAAQATALADRLGGRAIAAIHSSPRRRAVDTAQPLAARLGLPVIRTPALDEIDFGTWTGARFDALNGDPVWDRWNAARGTARVPGGEDMHEAVARARRHIEACAIAGETLLCVTHCDIIRGLVAAYLGLDFDRLLAFDADPASVTTLALEQGSGRLVALNEGAS